MSQFSVYRSLAALALIFSLLQSGGAQTPAGGPPQLGAAAAKVRTQVQDLPVGGAVTVNMLNGEEYYGRIKSIEPESFSIREVDLKTDLTLRYENVKRVRKDYGRRGFNGKRIHPRRSLIATVIFIGALLALVIGLVASDKS